MDRIINSDRESKLGKKVKFIAERCCHLKKCCRCDKQASIFKYGAFFCGEGCSDSAGDWCLDDGRQDVPDFLEDLNAMHIVEKSLTFSEWTDYEKNLFEIISMYSDAQRGFQTIHEKAVAFLKTIGEWNNEL